MSNRDVIAFLVVGIVLIVAAVVVAIRTVLWMRRTVLANGVVVSMEARTDDEGMTSHYPVVRFNDAAGQQHVFTSNVTSNPGYKPQDSVIVRYDPAKPQSAAINKLAYLFLAPIVLGFIGLVFAVIAISIGMHGK